MTDPDRSEAVILHVEDSPADARLFREGLSDDVGSRLRRVRDGATALTFLRQRPPYEDAPRPDLVVLDLNLPKRSGIDVLESIKTDDDLRTIPVVVLTSSDAPEDIKAAYRRHANAYLRKPMGIDECESLVERIEAFWLRSVKFAGHTRDNK
jgi:CheY-like chemotaxis protein